MKFTQKYISITVTVIGLLLFSSCADQFENEIPYPNDVTFNDLTLGRFTFNVADAPFTAKASRSGEITVNVSKNNDGSFSGFALSNKNSRSYPWNLSPTFAPAGGLSPEQEKAAIDSTAFSVYTGGKVNRTENFLVGNTNDDNAFFTLSSPKVVEHVLVANTTYNALLTSYGSIYSRSVDTDTQMYEIDGDPRPNPNIANPDPNREGVFTLPGVDGTLNTIRLAGTELLAKHEAGDAAGISAGEAARDAFIADNPGSTPEEQQAVYDDAYEDAYDVAADEVHKGYVKLTIEGSLNGNTTGTVDVYLAIRPDVDPAFPGYSYILSDWRKVDLTSLGSVDKVLFKMSSDYVDNQGKMVYPSLFCLDGIRLQ